MAALYLHIPFCASRCIYCGFYSTTLSSMRGAYADALCREMTRSASGAPFSPIGSVYLGGGTPSQLSPAMLQQLFTHIYNVYRVNDGAEITIECNPDDVTPDMAHALRDLPVNRVSMGAQTFSDARLQFLQRRHTARQVALAVERLRSAGINNISIDLMYGFPNETANEWDADIQWALRLAPQHISAYCLTIEEGTALHRMLTSGAVSETADEDERAMYYHLIDRLEAAGYVHYEISNFARHTDGPAADGIANDYRSRHNSAYWDGTPYLGIGAAAHSYDGRSRWWNVSDVKGYIRRILNNQSAIEEVETLDTATSYNDMVMTSLRTTNGLSMNRLVNDFGAPFHDYLMANAQPHLSAGRLALYDGRLRLTREGLFVSDDIMADLMWV